MTKIKIFDEEFKVEWWVWDCIGKKLIAGPFRTKKQAREWIHKPWKFVDKEIHRTYDIVRVLK